MNHYRAALEADDRLAPAHLAMARLLVAEGRRPEAVQYFARFRELQPDDEVSALEEAAVLASLERFEESRAVLEDAYRRGGENRTVAYALARLIAGAPDRSLRDGRRSLSLVEGTLDGEAAPFYAETKAMALAAVGRYKEAAELQRSVLEELRRRGLVEDAERVARNLARYDLRMTCCSDPRDVVSPWIDLGSASSGETSPDSSAR